jgi:hypothetical protein
MPGQPSQNFQLAPGEERYVNFGGAIGGPVSVSYTATILVSQRVQYYSSFNEIWSA